MIASEDIAARPMGVRIADMSDVQALSSWCPAIRCTLDTIVDLGELRGRICVVQREDDRVVLFLLAEYAYSDAADEIERLLIAKGYVLDVPTRYRTPAPLLLAVAERVSLVGSSSVGTPERSALASAFDEIITWAVRNDASDVHFNVNRRAINSTIRFSIEGHYLLPEQYSQVPTRTLLDMLAVAWMRVRGGNGAVFDPSIEQQGRIDMQVDRRALMLRWASLAADSGPSVCLRILQITALRQSCNLRTLGFLPEQIALFERASDLASGAVVVSGAVGSGKSTTLAAVLGPIAARRKLITIEDPVEYVIDDAIQNTLSRSLDQSEKNVFDAKLMTIKRSAMDDMMIGELRDQQTGRAFMDLAASGGRVYATTHTSSVALIPERLGSDFIGISRDLMASPGVLKLLVYQTLFNRLCDGCAIPSTEADVTLAGVDPDAMYHTFHALGFAAHRLSRRNVEGCAACRRTGAPALWGYAGRTVVAEFLVPSDDRLMLDCIRNRDTSALLLRMRARLQSSGSNDPRFWNVGQCALYKVARGELDIGDVHARFDLENGVLFRPPHGA